MPQFVEEDAENRCQGHIPNGGQCRYEAEPGNTLCRGCGGTNLIAATAKRQYLLKDARSATRLSQLAESDTIKSLRDEVALARMMLERRFNLIKDDNDFIASSGAITQMLLTVDKLVKTCHSMEQDLGTLLSRTAVLKIAERMIQIIAEELTNVPNYEVILDRVAGRLTGTLDPNVIEAEFVVREKADGSAE